MPFYLYGLLILEKPKFWGLNELESPDMMLAKIREKGYLETLNTITKNSDHPALKVLFQRRTVDKASQKPSTRTAEWGLAA